MEHAIPLREFSKPVLREKLPIRSSFALDLKPYSLNKGDRIELTIEAVDFRGGRPGRSASSRPLTLYVTDESGVVGVLSDSDEQSAQQLDTIKQSRSAHRGRSDSGESKIAAILPEIDRHDRPIARRGVGQSSGLPFCRVAATVVSTYRRLSRRPVTSGGQFDHWTVTAF